MLHAEDQMAHRGANKPRTNRRPEEIVATGPNQVWSWDSSYLPAAARGSFYYLYLFVDVWSRRIMKAVVLGEESAEHAARLLTEACADNGVDPKGLTLDSDNGGPMKGATMLATMQWLGIVPSFSRPSVSDDNPYSEALFRTLKYVPSYPRKPFASIDAAWAWVERFVAWYNGEHRHSAIGFVTPDERHHGRDVAILLARATSTPPPGVVTRPAEAGTRAAETHPPRCLSISGIAKNGLGRRLDSASESGRRPSMVPPLAPTTPSTLPRHHTAAALA